jgi:hypothetical protein
MLPLCRGEEKKDDDRRGQRYFGHSSLRALVCFAGQVVDALMIVVIVLILMKLVLSFGCGRFRSDSR